MKLFSKVFIFWIVFNLIILQNLQVFAKCSHGYCRNTNEEMFIQNELKFIEDMYAGKHAPQKEAKNNKCPFHISSIAYWFAVVESSTWKSKFAQETNNWHSVKKWSWKYRYNWKQEYWITPWTNYLKYPDPFLSTLDLMYLYKYWYRCKLWYEQVVRYKMWAHIDDHNSQRYYKNLMASIRRYEKKYFWKKSIDDYNYYNPMLYKIQQWVEDSQNKVLITVKETINEWKKVLWIINSRNIIVKAEKKQNLESTIVHKNIRWKMFLIKKNNNIYTYSAKKWIKTFKSLKSATNYLDKL